MSTRFHLTKDLDVLEFEAVSKWGYPRHRHNFFELTFILAGSGQHLLNDSIVDYQKGDLFFLTPHDEHEFVVTEPSRFGLIKFTEQFFTEKSTFLTNTYWRRNIDAVVYHANVIAESIISHPEDRPQLFALYGLIKNELKNTLPHHRNVLTELFGALLLTLSRNLYTTLPAGTARTDREHIENILTYIRQHVLDKDKIRIKAIAEHFRMSHNYVGVFLKKHANVSVRQYVIQTKLNLAERLLQQTNLTISEIANKLAFTDASHFNRIFKKHRGINPSTFRGNSKVK